MDEQVGIEIGQGVEVDQAGADQRRTEIDTARHVPLEARPGIKHLVSVDDDFAVGDQSVAAIAPGEHPSCGYQRSPIGPFTQNEMAG